MNEALSGIVRLNFRRGAGGSGINLTTDAGTPPPRYGASCITYRGRVYIFGGIANGPVHETLLLNDCWVLSVATDRSHFGSLAPGELHGSMGYFWQEVPLRSQTRPPPCAFHLSGTHNGYMYIYISQSVLGEDYQKSSDWLFPVLNRIRGRGGQHEQNLTPPLMLKPAADEAFRRRIQRGMGGINQLWRLDLEQKYPQWEHIELTANSKMKQVIRGGIAMNFFGDRLYIYGVVTSSSFVSIGILDVDLRQWVTTVRLPGAPIW